MKDWVSGWLGAAWSGGPVGGYARLAEGLVGDVIASFTLDLPEGFGSWDSTPVTICFLRYDPARSCVDYIVHIDAVSPTRSLEGTARVPEDFEMKLCDSWPAEVFQRLIEANTDLGIFALSQEQADELCWGPCADGEHPPRRDHLWRPVDLSED